MPQPLLRDMRGFSLIEMAIVLLIAGLLVAGAWQLTSTMQQQRADQATANEMRVVVGALERFVRENNGALAGVLTQPGISNQLLSAMTLPSGNAQTIFQTGYLPPSFDLAAKGYQIGLRRYADVDNRPNIKGLIVRRPDRGLDQRRLGRIASLVGSQGGVVRTPAVAAGALGSWQANPADFSLTGAPIVAANDIAAFTTTVDAQINTNLLSRIDTGNTEANTMRTDLLMGAGDDNAIRNAVGVGLERTSAVLNTVCDSGFTEILQENGSAYAPQRTFANNARIRNMMVLGVDTSGNPSVLQCRDNGTNWVWRNAIASDNNPTVSENLVGFRDVNKLYLNDTGSPLTLQVKMKSDGYVFAVRVARNSNATSLQACQSALASFLTQTNDGIIYEDDNAETFSDCPRLAYAHNTGGQPDLARTLNSFVSQSGGQMTMDFTVTIPVDANYFIAFKKGNLYSGFVDPDYLRIWREIGAGR